jgi:aryl-alcohol dehydrogenase-like predicted oxidoreductase
MKVVARALGWLNPSPVRRLLPAVVEQGAGFMAFVPFQKGWLFDLGRQAGVSDEKTARFGLSWALTRPGVTTVLCGAATPDQAAANARAAAWPMTEAEMADVARRLAATEAYAAFYRRIHQAAPQLAVDRRKEPVT